MNSLVALSELQSAKKKKHQEKLQCEEIKKQLNKITELQEKKNLLTSRLLLLSQGNNPADIDAGENSAIKVLYNDLWNLQEKLSAYRIIGPCGTTVLDKTQNHLVISFTSSWLQVTESFILKIKTAEGQLKMSSTTIPYFINVQSALEDPRLSLTQQIDTIGHMINAFIQRKGELHQVKEDLKNILTHSAANEAVTNIELRLSREGSTDNAVFVYLVYPNMDALRPETAKISLENIEIPRSSVSNLVDVLKEKTLSQAISDFIPFLT